jgi:hypothetical protein
VPKNAKRPLGNLGILPDWIPDPIERVWGNEWFSLAIRRRPLNLRWWAAWKMEQTPKDIAKRGTHVQLVDEMFSPVQINGTGPIGRALEEQKIDSIRNRSNN